MDFNSKEYTSSRTRRFRATLSSLSPKYKDETLCLSPNCAVLPSKSPLLSQRSHSASADMCAGLAVDYQDTTPQKYADYITYLKYSYQLDFSDISDTEAVLFERFNENQHNILIITPSLYVHKSGHSFVTRPSKESVLSELSSNLGGCTSLARLFLYIIMKLDEYENDQFSIIFCNSGFKWLSWEYYSFLGELHKTLPRRCSKNLEHLFILHPENFIRKFFVFGELFLSSKFYKKLKFCENIADLLNFLPPRIIVHIPEFVYLFETKGFYQLNSNYHQNQSELAKVEDTCGYQQFKDINEKKEREFDDSNLEVQKNTIHALKSTNLTRNVADFIQNNPNWTEEVANGKKNSNSNGSTNLFKNSTFGPEESGNRIKKSTNEIKDSTNRNYKSSHRKEKSTNWIQHHSTNVFRKKSMDAQKQSSYESAVDSSHNWMPMNVIDKSKNKDSTDDFTKISNRKQKRNSDICRRTSRRGSYINHPINCTDQLKYIRDIDTYQIRNENNDNIDSHKIRSISKSENGQSPDPVLISNIDREECNCQENILLDESLQHRNTLDEVASCNINCDSLESVDKKDSAIHRLSALQNSLRTSPAFANAIAETKRRRSTAVAFDKSICGTIDAQFSRTMDININDTAYCTADISKNVDSTLSTSIDSTTSCNMNSTTSTPIISNDDAGIIDSNVENSAGNPNDTIRRSSEGSGTKFSVCGSLMTAKKHRRSAELLDMPQLIVSDNHVAYDAEDERILRQTMTPMRGLILKKSSRHLHWSAHSSSNMQPNLDPKTQILGIKLGSAVRILNAGGLNVPWLVLRCIGYLSTDNRLNTVGLFRVSGDPSELDRLKKAVNGCQQVLWDETEDSKDEKVNFLKISNPHIVAQLLKAYFRELPDPIFPAYIYHDTIAIAKAVLLCGPSERWISAMKHLLWKIPSTNYSTLKILLIFMKNVSKRSNTNLMTSRNLGIVWGPNLLRGTNTCPMLMLQELKFVTDTVTWLIEKCDDIFADDF